MSKYYIVMPTSKTMEQVKEYVSEKGFPIELLSFPTMVAVDDDKVTGVISTIKDQEVLTAGPIIADTPIKALRLIESYEKYLHEIGIVFYRFAVDAKNSKWLDMIVRGGGDPPFEFKDGQYWFRRIINQRKWKEAG